MSSQKKEFFYPGLDAGQLLQFAYGTFLHLGWEPRYTGPGTLIGYTPRSWKKYDDEILIEATDGSLSVTSSLVHGESFDLTGKNKKHIQAFINAFESIKSSPPDPQWAAAIEQLTIRTEEVAEEEYKKAEEVTRVMGVPGTNLIITYSILGINALVFVLMAINGAGLIDPNGLVHIRWGSNYTPLTLGGEWWRLITCVFIHFGIIHIVMNSYALYMAGVYLEPMLGKTKFTVAYLCTGVLASIASLWWHKEGVNSAGASGAIFGLYGVFLALLFTNLIPKKIRMSLLQSIGVFVVYNLIYGMKSGVDNAAHTGGLISGLVIGFIYYLVLKKEEEERKNPVTVIAISAATLAFSWFYLDSGRSSVTDEELQDVKSMLQTSAYKDGEKFIGIINEFSELESKALAPMSDTSLTNALLAEKLKDISRPAWEKAASLIANMKDLDISDTDKKKGVLLSEYVEARREEISVIIKIANEEQQQDYDRLNAVRDKISGIINSLGDLR